VYTSNDYKYGCGHRRSGDALVGDNIMSEEYTPLLLPRTLAEQVSPTDLAALVREYLTRKADYARQGVSYGGLTTVVGPPVVSPAHVRFRDPTTGDWLTGVSEPKIDPNHLRIDLRVAAYAPCAQRRHHRPAGCACAKALIGLREGPANLAVNNLAKFIQAAIMGQTTSITDTTSNSRSITATVDGGVNQRQGHAGTGVTAATVADIAMQTSTENVTAVTINAVSGAGATGTFTVTFTIVAGAARSYTEVGLVVRTTTNSWLFLLTHDSFAALSVSSGGSLAVTYTFTNA
jgi:hypothetical protein